MTRLLTVLTCTLIAAACGSAGDAVNTFDNTGGAPPPGNSISFESMTVTLDGLCVGHFVRARFAVLARTGADIPVIDGNQGCTASLRAALGDTFASLTADQAVAMFTLNLGGCVRSYEIARVSRDGLVVRPWVLLHDTTLGAIGPVACTTDAIPVLAALRVAGAAGANAIEPHLGRINPNHPRDSAASMF